MNSGVIREITKNSWWTSYGVLHFPRDNKNKGVAEWFQKILNFKNCISVGRDIHVDVDIQVSKLQELVHGLWTRQWISVQRRNYAYT